MVTVVRIDLAGVVDARSLLARLGESLELGGPDGNHRVSDPNTTTGWGMNWDALADCLSCLETGGIWGTSRRHQFPMCLRLENVDELQEENPEALATLEGILKEAQTKYSLSSLCFEYSILRH